MADTLVTFGSGAASGSTRVVRVVEPAETGDRRGPAVIVDETPFHPVDHAWPDQPGDTGWCADLEVVDADAPASGQIVELRVDRGRRSALSAAPTGCHLAALAMNLATSHLWRKPARTDSLGSPDLDQIAMQSSVMDLEGSTDVYRLGKSLRKKGFDAAGLADQLDNVAAAVAEQLTAWIAAGGPVAIDDAGDRRISARREWTCGLPEGIARLPCGGTHVAELADVASLSVVYQLSADGSQLTVRTTPTRH